MTSHVPCTTSPLAGLYQAPRTARMYYGAGSVAAHLEACLPSASSRALIVTGRSLAAKTPLIKGLEAQLGARHAATFSEISAHAPAAQVEAAAALATDGVDTVISVGGGSPIDAAKVVSARAHARTGAYLRHVAIPTTLGAAEVTSNAGYTGADGLKTGVSAPDLAPWAVIYDAGYARHTPPALVLQTALRALDHAVEMLCNSGAAEAPTKLLCLQAVAALFRELPRYRDDPQNEDTITRLQLAAFASLHGLGLNAAGPLGLSHTLGYAIGSPYGVPHGVTSCLTLAPVVRLKARSDPAAAAQIARALPFTLRADGTPGVAGTDPVADALAVADAIERLVQSLGLATTLTEQGVPEGQADLIAERATRTKEGELFDAVRDLVRGLY